MDGCSIIAASAIVAVTPIIGCAKAPYAASVNPARSRAASASVVWNRDQQRDVRSIFDELAAGYASQSQIGRAVHEMRWSDVPQAAMYAADDNQMAIVSRAVASTEYVFQLKTVEDWPAQLTVTRLDDEQVYHAEAVVGRFGDHADRAAALLTSLDDWMLAFGRKRSLGE